jgi:signal transduction histidine kinase
MKLEAHMNAKDQVVIQFTDNGVGMTEEVRKRVFDPFFTTKLGQGGSGLGMNIVYNIVKEILGGTIVIAATPKTGVQITVVIPTTAPQSQAG